MTESLFTIVVVQRERFSMAKASLMDLYDKTPGSFPLIYVDGNSPREHASWLQAQAVQRGFQILRQEHYLSQHAAYNLALPLIKTKYVIFCDNDVTFSKNWISELLDFAEKNNSAVVCPVYLEKLGSMTQIHMAGGNVELVKKDDRIIYNAKHFLAHRPLNHLDNFPEAQETALIEYHAFLAQTETLRRLNPFDPNLLSARDHSDASLILKSAGERCFITKKAQVTYHLPPPFSQEDLTFFTTRWSEAWNQHSSAYFEKKWGFQAPLSPWFGQHRRSYLQKITAFLQPFIGYRNSRRLYYRILDPVIGVCESAWNRYQHQQRYHASFERLFGLFDLKKNYPKSQQLPLPKNDAVFSVKDSFDGG
jgi:glycosyltransferase involved in cell wall biosynthesis